MFLEYKMYLFKLERYPFQITIHSLPATTSQSSYKASPVQDHLASPPPPHTHSLLLTLLSLTFPFDHRPLPWDHAGLVWLRKTANSVAPYCASRRETISGKEEAHKH